MAGPDAERLSSLVATLRQQMGEGVLADPGRLSALLSDHAPDLQAVIRGMAAAMRAQTAIHIRAAANPLVAGQLAAARLAAEQGLTPAQAADAIEVAVRITNPVGVAPILVARDATEWVGVTTPFAGAMPAGPVQPGPNTPPPASPDTPASPPAAAPFDLFETLKRRKWIVGAAVAAALFAFNQSEQVTTSRPPAQPAAPTQPAAPPRPAAPAEPSAPHAQRELPILSPDEDNLPEIEARNGQGGIELDFAVRIPDNILVGTVVLKSLAWESGQIAFAHQGSSQAESLSTAGDFKLVQTKEATGRLMVPVWTRDNAHAGPICVLFGGPRAQDVALKSSEFCLLEKTATNCSKLIGCGRVN